MEDDDLVEGRPRAAWTAARTSSIGLYPPVPRCERYQGVAWSPPQLAGSWLASKIF